MESVWLTATAPHQGCSVPHPWGAHITGKKTCGGKGMDPCLWQEGGPMKVAYPWVSTSSLLHNHSLLFLTPLFFTPFLWPTYEPQHRGHWDKSLSPSGPEVTCYGSSGPCFLQGTQPSAPLPPKLERPGHPGQPGGRGHYCPPLEEVLSYTSPP